MTTFFKKRNKTYQIIMSRISLVVLLFLLVPYPLQVGQSFDVNTETQFEIANSSLVYATDRAEEVYNAVSEDSFKQFVRKVSENGTREYGTVENAYARSWIKSQLDNVSNGQIEVTEIGDYKSVLGKLPGALGDDGPVVMIGGHYDTVNVPGANDDGTGVATTLELARVLSNYSWPLDIYFGFWNAEEIGLYGAFETAYMFQEAERDILIYFNIDMLLVQNPDAPVDERVWMVYDDTIGSIFQDSQYWAELSRVMNNNFETPIILPYPAVIFPYYMQSDHYAFHEMGYRSTIFAFESGVFYDHWFHTVNDTWDNPNYNYSIATSTVASIGASIAYSLSRTEGQPTISSYDVSLTPGTSKDILIEMSIETDIVVNASWTGADGLEFSLSHDSVLDSHSTSAATGANTTVIDEATTNLGIHTLSIENTGSADVNVTIIISHETDIEGNGIADGQETWYNDFDVDSDSDGLNDGFEEAYRLPRYIADPDADYDGLSNIDEITLYGTDPMSSDTDSDGMPDLWEVQNGLDPLDYDDRMGDPDNDDLNNIREYQLGTNPNSADTDLDGMPDRWEHDNDLDPLIDDSALDPDADGLSNLDEYQNGLDPNVADWTNPVVFVSLGGGVVVVAVIIVVLLMKKRSA